VPGSERGPWGKEPFVLGSSRRRRRRRRRETPELKLNAPVQ
jgi:hypothetical protein